MNLLFTFLAATQINHYLNIGAAIFFPTLFVVLLLYYTLGPKKYPKPKIITLKNPLYVVGISTKTSKKTFLQDDLLLWKEYKLMKERGVITNKKEEHSFIALRLASESENTWEYVFGDIVNDFSNVPIGLKSFEIPPTTFAVFPIEVDDERSWGPAVLKMEKHIYQKWLPKSDFELDTNYPIREIEYHDKRTPETTRTMLFYIAIRPKKG